MQIRPNISSFSTLTSGTSLALLEDGFDCVKYLLLVVLGLTCVPVQDVRVCVCVRESGRYASAGAAIVVFSLHLFFFPCTSS